jgi:hypothetical protein
VAFILPRLKKITATASFLSPSRTVRFNPYVPPPDRTLAAKATQDARRRRCEVTLVVREATKWQLVVVAWHREVTTWRRESSLASSSRTASSNSVANFSPISYLPLSRPLRT